MIILTWSEYWSKGKHGWSSASLDIGEGFWHNYANSYYQYILDDNHQFKIECFDIMLQILNFRDIKTKYYCYMYDKLKNGKTVDFSYDLKAISTRNIKEINMSLDFEKQTFPTVKHFLEKDLDLEKMTYLEFGGWASIESRMANSLCVKLDEKLLKKTLKKEKYNLYMLIYKNESTYQDTIKLNKFKKTKKQDLYKFFKFIRE